MSSAEQGAALARFMGAMTNEQCRAEGRGGPSGTHHVLDAAVLALSVLADGDDVHIRVGSLVALDGHARAHIGVQVKGFTQQQIHGRVPCSNRGLQGPW